MLWYGYERMARGCVPTYIRQHLIGSDNLRCILRAYGNVSYQAVVILFMYREDKKKPVAIIIYGTI
jgi:hypothetical protein